MGVSWKDKFPKENRYFETNNGILYCGDCLEIMPKFPEKIFDVIITDPPYGTTACKWDVIIPFEDMWRELKRIRKDRTPIFIFSKQPFTSFVVLSNLNEFRYEIIWKKEKGVDFGNSNKKPLNIHENIIVFYKKQPKYHKTRVLLKGNPYIKKNNKKAKHIFYSEYLQQEKTWVNEGVRVPVTVIECSRDNIHRNKNFHPTQKPVKLIEWFLKSYTDRGDLVLDFCIGSGTTAVACEKLKRRWIGIEINPEYCEIAKQRILREIRQLEIELKRN